MSCGYTTLADYENGVLGYMCTWNKYTEWKRRKTRLVQINTQKYFTILYVFTTKSPYISCSVIAFIIHQIE